MSVDKTTACDIVSATTEGLPPRDKFERWCDVCRHGVVGLNCEAVDASTFDAAVTGVTGPDTSILRITASPCRIERDPETAHDASNAVIVNFVVAGQLAVEQDSRTAVVEPGDGVLCVADRRYVLQARHAHEIIKLRLPRTALHQAGDVHRFTASRFSNMRGGSLLYALAHRMSQETALADPLGLATATSAFVHLLETVLVLTDHGAPVDTGVGALARAKAFVESRLDDHNLDPRYVGAALRLSPRYLNKLFAREGTSLGRYIWARRLHHAAHTLTHSRGSITAIAIESGFKSMSHFSHAFRERFGLSPTEYRHQARGRSRSDLVEDPQLAGDLRERREKLLRRHRNL